MLFASPRTTMSGLQLWAPDAAFINDTYYLIYCAIERATNIFRTGIAVSPTPQGPFTDTGFVVGVEWGQDPALFVDHDDVPYLFWGSGGGAQMAQLTPDLKSAVPSSVKDLTKQLPNFYEGPWMFSRNGAYYLMYGWTCDAVATLCTHLSMHIGMLGTTVMCGVRRSSTPRHPTQLGPLSMEVCLPTWLVFAVDGCTPPAMVAPGVIMKTLDHYPEVGKSWTNHGSITKYKGQWYLFYHTTGLSNGHDKRRSFAIEYLHFDDEGGIWVCD